MRASTSPWRVGAAERSDVTRPPISEYFARGPSAAFFDLDRTLISGSSAFVLGVAAWRAGLVPPASVRAATPSAPWRSASPAPATTPPTACATASSARSTGMRVDDLVALERRRSCRSCSTRSAPRRRRSSTVHRHAGRATYIVSASPVELVEPLAKALGHDGRDRHRQRRSSTASTRASSPGRSATARARSRRSTSWPGGRASTSVSATPTATRPATCRCSRPSATRSRSTPTPSWSASPATTAGRSWCFSKRTKAVVRRTTQAARHRRDRRRRLRGRHASTRASAHIVAWRR